MRSRALRLASGWNLPLLVAAMDAAWIAPYALLLGAIWSSPGTPLLRAASLFSLLAAAQVLTRSLLSRPAGLTPHSDMDPGYRRRRCPRGGRLAVRRGSMVEDARPRLAVG